MSSAYHAITLPLPHKRLSPQNNGLPLHKAGYVKSYRQRCANECILRKLPKFTKLVIIHLDFYLARLDPTRYYPLDSSNARASFKAGLDGMCDAGIFQNDSYLHVEDGRTTLHRTKDKHKGRCCLILTIEVPGDDE